MTLRSAEQLVRGTHHIVLGKLVQFGLLDAATADKNSGNVALHSLLIGLLPIALTVVLRLFFLKAKVPQDKNKHVRDKVIVITGGSSGIGLELVRQLVHSGGKVVVFDIHPPPTKTIAPDSVHFYKVDVTDRTAVAEAASKVQKEVGEVSILINNAGITTAPGHFLEANIDRQIKTIDVNLLSHFYTNRAFLPAMVKRNSGHIVTVASAASFVTPAGAIDYGVAKTGLLAMHEGLQCEAATLFDAPDVQFTIVHPYFVTTPLIEGVFNNTKSFLNAEGVAGSIVDQLRTGRGGQLFLPGWITLTRIVRVLPRSLANAIRLRGARDVIANINADVPGRTVKLH